MGVLVIDGFPSSVDCSCGGRSEFGQPDDPGILFNVDYSGINGTYVIEYDETTIPDGSGNCFKFDDYYIDHGICTLGAATQDWQTQVRLSLYVVGATATFVARVLVPGTNSTNGSVILNPGFEHTVFGPLTSDPTGSFAHSHNLCPTFPFPSGNATSPITAEMSIIS